MNPYNNAFKNATHGKLIQKLPSGNTRTLKDNDIWANLQKEKKLLIAKGVPACQLLITHLR